MRSSLYPTNWTPAFTDASGRFLHDFSYAGYRQAGEDLIPTTPPGATYNVTAAPYNADNTGTNDAAARLVEELLTLENPHNSAAHVALEWQRSAPAAATAWALGLPEHAGKSAAITATIASWTARDPAAAGQFIRQETLTPAVQDELVQTYALILADSQPATAIDWASSITDDIRRHATIVSVARQWALSDPAASFEWLSRQQLPSDVIDRALAPRDPGKG